MPFKIPTTFTYALNSEQGKKLRQLLETLHFEFKPLAYGHFTAARTQSPITTLHYYLSGKLVIQGKEAKDFIQFHLEPCILEKAVLGYEHLLSDGSYQPHFGIDESGKGDFFGPLVIAGAYVDEELARKLAKLGVRDSKTITSDRSVRKLATLIRSILAKKHVIIVIGPERYNELYTQFKNLNHLLAWGHAKAIETLHQLVPNCLHALSDQFTTTSLIKNELDRKKISIQFEQRPHAEEDMAVAAASVLARSEYLERLEKLSQAFDEPLLKGASRQVKEQALRIVKAYDIDKLRMLAKTHFKTFSETQAALKDEKARSA